MATPASGEETLTPNTHPNSWSDTMEEGRKFVRGENGPVEQRVAISSTQHAVGSEVLRCEPLAVVATLNDVCSYCLKSCSSRCSRCQAVSFCSRSCLRKDYEIQHKMECRALQSLASTKQGGSVTPTLRLAARVLWAIGGKRGLNELLSIPLVHHMDDRTDKDCQLYHQMALLVQTLYLQSKPLPFSVPPLEEIARLLGAIACNAFSVTNEECSIVGIGLYIPATPFNHSCMPNCCVTFTGRELRVRCVKNVNSGEELCLSYTELSRPRAIRLKELSSAYFFQCTCQRCSEDYRLSESDEESSNLINAAKLASTFIAKGDPDTARKGLLTALKERSTVAEDDWKVIECHIQLMRSYIHLKAWKAAYSLAKRLVPLIEASYETPWPLTTCHMCITAKLGLFLSDPDAKYYLERARALIKITHGGDNPMMQQIC